MAAEIHEIKQYKYYTFSSRETSIVSTVILFYSDSAYLGGAFFYQNDSMALSPAVKYPSGVYGLFYHYADLPIIVDMLRNEKPIYLIYDGGGNTRIATDPEPIGEGEGLVP